MKLSKEEKELLLFCAASSIGTISINSYHKTNVIADRLRYKNLLKMHENNFPFCGNIIYYSLTAKGWEKADGIKKLITII